MVKPNSMLQLRPRLMGMVVMMGWMIWSSPVFAKIASPLEFRHLSIPILGLTMDTAQQPKGVVSYVVLHFQDRKDQEGLRLRFQKMPGKFSPLAQHAVKLAIERVAAAANLGINSWTVGFTFPYAGMTMYGDSLSAMVGLSVVALAKGHRPLYGRSITGTITEDGQIGPVGGVPQKILGAHQHLDRVLIPEEYNIGDGDWTTPFLMHVSPVSTMEGAYFGLTGQKLFSSQPPHNHCERRTCPEYESPSHSRKLSRTLQLIN